MLILVDMDGVLADFESAFLQIWRTQQPDKVSIALEDRRGFHLVDDYPGEYKELIQAIIAAPGFFRSLEPLTGGLEALKTMQDLGHDVLICTSPLENYQYCVPEKYEWVDHYLGQAWVNRIVLTRDKTVINGDVLIDDRPLISGLAVPAWEHVVYDQPYNRTLQERRRLTWQNWQTILFSAEAGAPASPTG
ncbi:MAG TPA: 5'-3'-deoxyribonucleotidase [Aggregatilineales bacterium]|nr:5'-3'-deoxyribonucleotidase [Aggregatilineales bacterium]